MKIHLAIIASFVLIGCSNFKEENSAQSSSTIFARKDILEVDTKITVEELIGCDKSSTITIEFNQLIIGKSGEIDLQGKDVTLKIKELISDSGTIRNNSTVNTGDASPGETVVEVGSANGTLLLNLDGANGPQGADGIDGQYKEPPGLKYSVLNGADGLELYSEGWKGHRAFACVKQPEDGKTPPALDGTNGGDGSDGGRSGSGRFIIQNDQGFEILVSNSIGKGGAAGRGGQSINVWGGRAGEVISKPGDAKTAIKNGAIDGACRRAVDGKQSGIGSHGTNGKVGKDGEKRLFCVENRKNKQCF